MHVTVRVRNCRAHVRVMRDVEITYESDDKANQGLYATVSHYSKPSHLPSFANSALRGRGGALRLAVQKTATKSQCLGGHRSCHLASRAPAPSHAAKDH